MATGYVDLKMAVKRNDIPVKMDAEVAANAKIAAAYQGLSLAEYISEVVRPIALRDMDEGHAKKMKGHAAKPKGAK